MARFYVVYLGILTFVYQAVVVAVLMDNPIIDARNGGWEATVFQILVKLYALSSLLVPIACSVWTIRHSGDTNSFKMAMAKNVFPGQGSDDIFNTIKSFVMGKSAIIVSLGVCIVGATFALTGSSPHPDIPSSIESSAVEVEGPILEHWPPSLHTLYNLAPPHPVTTAAASEAGWVKIDDPCNPLLGEAWLLQGERARNSSATLYFSPEVEGTPGHVTGIEVDYYGYIEDKLVGTYFSEAKTAKDGTYHSVSLALRDSEKYDLCDTKKPLAGGNDAYVAIGPDMANTMVPSTETDPELESSWKEGSCLHGMGTHWFSDAVSGKDLTLKTENTVPIVPMYNSFGDKKISGVFFMATERKQNWDFEACPIEGSPKEAVACNCFVHKNCNFWDKSPGLLQELEPPFYMCANMCGDCAFSGTKDGYFTTMHWFFHDAAATVSCPGGKFCREGAGEAH